MKPAWIPSDRWGLQSYSVSVTDVSLSLSLPVWEVLESRDMAGVIQICFLAPARALAPERHKHRNHARLAPPEASCKPSHPAPSAPGAEEHQIPNLFQVYL